MLKKRKKTIKLTIKIVKKLFFYETLTLKKTKTMLKKYRDNLLNKKWYKKHQINKNTFVSRLWKFKIEQTQKKISLRKWFKSKKLNKQKKKKKIKKRNDIKSWFLNFWIKKQHEIQFDKIFNCFFQELIKSDNLTIKKINNINWKKHVV